MNLVCWLSLLNAGNWKRNLFIKLCSQVCLSTLDNFLCSGGSNRSSRMELTDYRIKAATSILKERPGSISEMLRFQFRFLANWMVNWQKLVEFRKTHCWKEESAPEPFSQFVGHIVCYQSKCLEKEKWAFGIVHARPGLIYGGGDVLEIHLKWLASIFIYLQCEISMADSPINWFNQVDCLSDKRIPMIFWRSLSAALLLSLPLKRTGKRFKFSFEFIDPDCRSMRILQS